MQLGGAPAPVDPREAARRAALARHHQAAPAIPAGPPRVGGRPAPADPREAARTAALRRHGQQPPASMGRRLGGAPAPAAPSAAVRAAALERFPPESAATRQLRQLGRDRWANRHLYAIEYGGALIYYHRAFAADEVRLFPSPDNPDWYHPERAPNLIYLRRTDATDPHPGVAVFRSTDPHSPKPAGGDKLTGYLRGFIQQNERVLETIDRMMQSLAGSAREAMLGVLELESIGEDGARSKTVLLSNSGKTLGSVETLAKKLAEAQKKAVKAYDPDALAGGRAAARPENISFRFLREVDEEAASDVHRYKHLNCAAPKLLSAISAHELRALIESSPEHRRIHLSEVWFNPGGDKPVNIRGTRFHHGQITPSCQLCEYNLFLLAFREVHKRFRLVLRDLPGHRPLRPLADITPIRSAWAQLPHQPIVWVLTQINVIFINWGAKLKVGPDLKPKLARQAAALSRIGVWTPDRDDTLLAFCRDYGTTDLRLAFRSFADNLLALRDVVRSKKTADSGSTANRLKSAAETLKKHVA